MTGQKQKEYTVLFVDDEQDMLNMYTRAFRKYPNIEILTCSKPEKALDCIQSNQVQLLVTDQRMPGMTGAELLEQTKKTFPHIPGIIITAYSDFHLLQKAVNESQVYRIFTKPIQPDFLAREIQEAIVFHELQLNERRFVQQLQIERLEDLFDSMTGTYSKRALHEYFNRIILQFLEVILQFFSESLAKEKQKPLLMEALQTFRTELSDLTEEQTGAVSMLIGSADGVGLKEINNTYGHSAGDKAIKILGSCVNDTCTAVSLQAEAEGRKYLAIPFRPNEGGDEFVIIINRCEDIAFGEKVEEELKYRLQNPAYYTDIDWEIRSRKMDMRVAFSRETVNTGHISGLLADYLHNKSDGETLPVDYLQTNKHDIAKSLAVKLKDKTLQASDMEERRLREKQYLE